MGDIRRILVIGGGGREHDDVAVVERASHDRLLEHDVGELLERRVANDASLSGYVATASRAAQRGAELTKRLLTFARRIPLQPETVGVNHLVREAVEMFDRVLGETISVVMDLQAAPDSVSIDPAQMQSALLNIAVNARDAMGGTGRLEIKTCNVADVPGANMQADQGFVHLTVSDNGAGMPPAVLSRVFEPFFTTKGPGKGSGLGLSMVYGFVKQSGGYIGVTSALEKGTTFELAFPASAENPATSDASLVDDAIEPAQEPERAILAAVSPPEVQETAAKNTAQDSAIDPSQDMGPVILAVDDQPEVLATAVAHLRALGYHVLEANGAIAALERLATGARIDLLFTDIVMPGGMNGVDLAMIASSEMPDLKVLYTSGYPGSELTGGSELYVEIGRAHV